MALTHEESNVRPAESTNIMPKKKGGKKSGGKKSGKKSGKKGKRSAKGSAKSARGDKVSPSEVDILSQPAMENLYYIAHDAPQALDMRGFGWPDGGGGKGKKGKGKKGKKKKK